MCSTQNVRIVFKLCLLNMFVLLVAGNALNRLHDVQEFPESRSAEDSQGEQPTSTNAASETTESEFKRVQLLKKTMLKKLKMESPPNVTQNQRPALSSPVMRALLKEYGIDQERLQNEEDDMEDEITSQKLISTAKQPPFTTVTSFQNWFYFEFSPEERMNFRVKSANIWFYVKNISSSIPSATIKLDVLRPYVNQTGDEVVYIPIRHSSEMLNLTERTNSETWKYISITSLAASWLRDPTTNFGVKLYTRDVMNLIATGMLPGEEGYTPFLEVQLVSDHRRRKRNAGQQHRCQEDGINGCCVHDFIINFEEIGWDWIIFPASYNAKYCSGECSLEPMPNIHNTIVQATHERLISSRPAEIGRPNQPRSCCVPTKYAPLSLLYFDSQGNVIYSEVPDMEIKKCGCV